MAITVEAPTEPRTVNLTIDGKEINVPEGTTIWQAAKDAGIEIPVLCHDERYDAVGVCRMCVVDVGARVYAAACIRPCEDGMEVKTATPELERNRAQLTELLLVDQPPVDEDPKELTTADNELLVLVRRYGVQQDEATIARGRGRGEDHSNPVIAVNHDACILCDRCVRACDDIQGNDVIGRSGKGYSTRIAFDLNDPMGNSSCVTCGECVQACPTGALTNKPINLIPIQPRERLDAVDSVCPYCGVGCALTYYVDRERNAISFAEGRPQPGSQSRLCVKGRYGWDYAASPQRLTVPLIRRDESYPKGALSADVRGDMTNDRGRGGSGGGRSEKKGRSRKPGGLVDYDEVMPHFREATWEEALDLVARRLLEIHASGGPGAIAGFGSAKCSNEEAYLFQKLIRAGFGTNNVDHCTRLCHASSVAALFEGIGSGAVSTTYADVANAEVVIITGSNPTANHPVASSFFKQARRRGTKIIYVDPRASGVSEHADYYCQVKPGTDVAFYNAVMHEVIRLGLIDREFIADRTSNYEELARTVADYPPERAAQITGVEADLIREVARVWGEAKAGIIY
ncbi:MAG TPA: molybdopterin-dependent oxidoreductase, partial [Nocardioidaceae bacterium]|nr:molybdopterin-dependent oxidoreductase [Nocardioidaceae bacterium]